MGREEAIQLAEAFWRERDLDYRLDPGRAELVDGPPGYPYDMQETLPSEPHWRIPLEFCRPGWVQLGAHRELLVFTESRSVRLVQWGE